MKKYAEAIKTRQQKYKMIDVAEYIVDNKMLINRVDDMLNQRHSADDGKQYYEIPNITASVSAKELSNTEKLLKLAPISGRN